ncbi:cyclin-like F-box [Podospora aff. communis PSN243]|uniref:Cyclin-like F-box n=1 Tax=Podospora aff. communis PSN243 TaxID=3040156 RepID=A0AAV9H3Q6_9PEZI|nr:cyclin-like F-box [Podospora aff. communis PSN243]
MTPVRKPATPSSSPDLPSYQDNLGEAHGDIVSLDPAVPITPIPLIADILRTEHCIPGSIFLVEGVENAIPVTLRYRTVRVLLGDGELVIQALAKPGVHCLLDRGDVYEGAYVRVGKAEVRFVDVDVDGEKKRMPFLVVEDVVTVGWHRGVLREVDAEEGEEGAGEVGMEDEEEEEQSEDLVEESEEGEVDRDASPCPVRETAKAGEAMQVEKKAEDEVDYFSGSDDAFETLEISVERAAERRTQAVPQHVQVAAAQAVPPRAVVQQRLDPKAKADLPWMVNDPTQPMKLTDLQSIPKLPYKQNWMVNVLAVVTWLSDIEPTYLPPGTQRRARLADHTTDKQVSLTVLLDPNGFTPQIGSVVLLVGVKNHQFEGGSLRKYMSDKIKIRKRWWVEHPEDSLEWCQEEAMLLREWWDAKMLEGS